MLNNQHIAIDQLNTRFMVEVKKRLVGWSNHSLRGTISEGRLDYRGRVFERDEGFRRCSSRAVCISHVP